MTSWRLCELAHDSRFAAAFSVVHQVLHVSLQTRTIFFAAARLTESPIEELAHAARLGTALPGTIRLPIFSVDPDTVMVIGHRQIAHHFVFIEVIRAGQCAALLLTKAQRVAKLLVVVVVSKAGSKIETMNKK